MITKATQTEASSSVQERITQRAFVQAMAMIHMANNRKDKRPTDPKVGGHPASCASAMHTLAALHLEVREPQDFVCCKPHASPECTFAMVSGACSAGTTTTMTAVGRGPGSRCRTQCRRL